MLPVPPRLTRLQRLPIPELRRFSTQAYNHLQARFLSVVGAWGVVSVEPAQLIALYPPEVAPEDALRPPLGYPTWRFYIDGRWLYIANAEEYLRLAPGHSGRPDGPWPQDVTITGSWTVGQGPYAPVPGWTPARSAPYPTGPAAAMIYATRPLVYAGWGRSRGEIFRL